jgi:hypothetical protein
MSDPKKKDPAKAPVKAPEADDPSPELGATPDEPPAPSVPRSPAPPPPPVAPEPTPPPPVRVTTGPNGTVTNEIGGGS